MGGSIGRSARRKEEGDRLRRASFEADGGTEAVTKGGIIPTPLVEVWGVEDRQWWFILTLCFPFLRKLFLGSTHLHSPPSPRIE